MVQKLKQESDQQNIHSSKFIQMLNSINENDQAKPIEYARKPALMDSHQSADSINPASAYTSAQAY